MSAIMFAASLIIVPILLTRLPADYFVKPKRPRPWASAHPAARAFLDIASNVIGALLVLAGLAMLVLPGQGVLAILGGLVLLDFPGKHKLELWILSRGPVERSINWLRKRRGKPALILRH